MKIEIEKLDEDVEFLIDENTEHPVIEKIVTSDTASKGSLLEDRHSLYDYRCDECGIGFGRTRPKISWNYSQNIHVCSLCM